MNRRLTFALLLLAVVSTFALLATVLGLALSGKARAQLAPVPVTQASVSIAGTAASASVLIAGVPGQRIYVTSVDLVPVPTSVVTFTARTGSACGGSTASITGALTFSAGQTYSKGDGNGAVWVLGLGLNLCITMATATAPGSISYSIY